MSTDNKNVIEQRLDWLHDQWVEFAQNADARILRWVLRADEISVFEAFLEVESHDELGSNPDLFFPCSEPFNARGEYGLALEQALVAFMEAVEPELSEADVPNGWQPPAPSGQRDDLGRWLEVASSLHVHYSELLDLFVCVLTPESVADLGAWVGWLWAFAERAPSELRLIVLDSAEAPTLGSLAQMGPRIVSQLADLRMPDAYTELARAGGGLEEPGGQFRMHYVALTNAAGSKDLPQAEHAAEGALSLCRAHHWPHLMVPVHAALGAAYLAEGRAREAIETYRKAELAGQQVEESGAEEGTRMRLSAKLGVAASELAAEDLRAACDTYVAAVPLAEKLGDGPLTIECWRMAAYCQESLGNPDEAWAFGQRALDTAESMDEETRQQSLLPYVGASLLRLTERRPYKREREPLLERMTRLTGREDWLPDPDAPGGGA